MRIGVFGLGYVGCVTGACLARMGHQVCGVDISPIKVRMINEGHSPVLEEGLDRLVAEAARGGKFRASLRAADAVEGSDVSLVCVGTPSRRNGGANLHYVLRAAGEIGRALRSSDRYHTIAVRSTVPPGTTENFIIPEVERTGRKRAGRNFDVVFHPEFLREGSSVYDFRHPPKTVIGTPTPRGAARLLELWRPIQAPLFVTSVKAAEMVKYVDNAFHALKVAFANEVGALCKRLDTDSQEVMRIFVQDRKLNISPLYLKPGFAFGGPCLPKDLRALGRMGRDLKLDIPLLSSILASNSRHLSRARELVLATGKKRIGVLGLSFKSNTDDLRESPACALVKSLLRAKRAVRVYDPRVELSKLLGANRAFVKKQLPELPRLLTSSLGEAVDPSEVIVVAGVHPEFEQAFRRLGKKQVLIDLVGLASSSLPAGIQSASLC